MNTALFLLRAYQAGIGLNDLEILDAGMVMDIIIEASNDHAIYAQKATQDAFDRF